MASFAIVRADGSIDKAEGASVQDVADRYGWPGDGDIRPLEAGDVVRHSFESVEHQGSLINDKPKPKRTAEEKATRKAAKTAKASRKAAAATETPKGDE